MVWPGQSAVLGRGATLQLHDSQILLGTHQFLWSFAATEPDMCWSVFNNYQTIIIYHLQLISALWYTWTLTRLSQGSSNKFYLFVFFWFSPKLTAFQQLDVPFSWWDTKKGWKKIRNFTQRKHTKNEMNENEKNEEKITSHTSNIEHRSEVRMLTEKQSSVEWNVSRLERGLRIMHDVPRCFVSVTWKLLFSNILLDVSLFVSLIVSWNCERVQNCLWDSSFWCFISVCSAVFLCEDVAEICVFSVFRCKKVLQISREICKWRCSRPKLSHECRVMWVGVFTEWVYESRRWVWISRANVLKLVYIGI